MTNEEYYSRAKKYFNKNQKALVDLANSPTGRFLLDITHPFPIFKVSPNSFHYQIGWTKDRKPVYQAQFWTFDRVHRALRPYLENVVLPARRKPITLPPSWARLLRLAGIRRDIFLPQIGLTTSTFNPNSGGDGYVFNTGTTWSTVHDAGTGGGANSGSTIQYAQTDLNGSTYEIDRAFSPYDTSSLTSGATVSAADVKFWVNAIDNTGGQGDSVSLCKSTQASGSALATSDFGQVTTTKVAADKTVASLSTGAFSDFTITDLTVVNITGYSKFVLRMLKDVNNSAPSGTSNDVGWQTNQGANPPVLTVTYTVTNPPTVTTDSVSGVTSSQATAAGTVSSDGGASLTDRGFVWSLNSNPTTSDNKVQNLGQTGSFSSNITGLSPNTTYHVRAYGINSAGTAYGADIQFTTSSGSVGPTMSTEAANNIRTTKATLNGTVVNNNGAALTDAGFIISTNRANMTIALGTQISTGPQTGVFSADAILLTGSTRYFYRSYAINANGTGYGNVVPFTTPSLLVKKTFYYKVYAISGVFSQIWSKDVINLPSFRNVVNGGHGDLTIQLARKFDDFGEGVDVALNNRVELWVVDDDAHQGVLMYAGYISGYNPIFDGVKEYVEIKVFPYEAEFGRFVLRDVSGNTSITYTNTDPATIIKDIIDKYRALGGTIKYTATSIAMANQQVTYTFSTQTIRECLDVIISMYPLGYYWRVDPDGVLYILPKNTLADYNFTLGLQLNKLTTFRRIENLVNRVVFTGGPTSSPLFSYTQNTSSIGQYGLSEVKMIDQRVTDLPTANKISSRLVNNQKDPEIYSQGIIIDSNGPNELRGFDIEQIKPGQTMQISNLKVGTKTDTLWDIGVWDQDVWDATLASTAANVIQILSTTWSLDTMEIEASSRLPLIAQRVEEIARRLEAAQTVNNPSAPTAN